MTADIKDWEHLVAVLFEQKHSSFHETYKKKRKTAKEHCAVIFPGFAPFETDDHVLDFAQILGGYLCKALNLPPQDGDMRYLADVCIPEVRTTMGTVEAQVNRSMDMA